MTHFTIGIIAPPNVQNIERFIESQMEPYREHSNHEPYVCYSVEKAKADIERDILRLGRIIERQETGYDLEKCRTSLAYIRGTTPEQRYREYLDRHDTFNAKGEPLSTYNPKSKWDWYSIGGRWDGWITHNKLSSERGRNVGAKREEVSNNIATTEEAIKCGFVPHAIITPEGEWLERGRLGWFALLITENEEWDDEAQFYFESHPGHFVVILDAHI